MTLASMGMVLLAPAASSGGNPHISISLIIIIAIVAVLGLVAILGWRAPDRSPHADEKAEREREDR